MNIQLDYGRTGLRLSLPESAHVSICEPTKGAPLPDPDAAVTQALAQPIGVISDKTRPVPNAVVLPPILRTLEAAGIPPARIEILVATGLHRANTRDELIEMTSAAIVERYRFRNHVARNVDEHVHLGHTTRGTEIWIDRGFLAAELRIVTGLIEPHLMAGYSGGRKGVAPGLAGVDTMRSAHGPTMLEDNVGPGIVDGNPFHEDLLEIVRLARADFLVDVSIDRSRRLTGVFAGHMEQAHAVGMRHVEREVRVDLDTAADIVITSAGGYPLDATFYQSIKGLTGALNVVRRGGTIILAAALTEGIGSQDFQALLHDATGNDEFMARITSPGFFRVDQWMVQHLCQVLRKADVMLCTDGLPAEVVRGLLVTPALSLSDAVSRALQRHGEHAHIAVLPQGPYVLATVQGRKLSLGRAWMDAA